MYTNKNEEKKLRETTTNIIKRVLPSRGYKYTTFYLFIPKEIWSDAMFLEQIATKIKDNRIPVKIRIIAENEEVKIKGPALLITPIDQ